MTVAELIRELTRHPPEMIVSVNGYEGGYTDRFAVRRTRVVEDYWAGMGYYGEHGGVYDDDDESPRRAESLRLVLDRENPEL